METTANRKLIFSAVIAAAFLASHSCRTVKPTLAPGLKDATRPQDSTNPLQPGNGSRQLTTEILQWVIVKPGTPPTGPVGSGSSQGVFAWDIEVRTGLEIWCERRCSEFNVDETEEAGVHSLKAVKTSILGNTTPGMLKLQKQLSGERSKISKVKLENIGMMGQSVTIEDVIDTQHPNFYAVPMMITKPQGSAKGIVRGEFDGHVVEIRQVDTELETLVAKSTSPQQGFVMGSLTTETGPDGKNVEVFQARKILLPWTGE
jgi:hypothetical protein